MAIEELFGSTSIPQTGEDLVIPIALIPHEFRGTRMSGLTYFIRDNPPGEPSDLWLLDLGTLANSGNYTALTPSLPLTVGRGVHIWDTEVDFPPRSMIAIRVRQQGFPPLLNDMVVFPHMRIRGGRDG